MTRLLLIGAVTVATVGCSSGTAGGGGSPIAGDVLHDRLDGLPVASLSDAEIAGLIRMRQEEQLARDVYTVLGDQYDLRVFDNIARAEQTHTDAVKALLDRHGLDDPAAGRSPGSFADQELQALYDDLVASGRTSTVDALSVGAAIEEIDIVDLQQRATDTADIAVVYGELEKGSRNHLRAFDRQLDQRGVSYTPTTLDAGAFDDIVSSPTERGTTG